MVYGFLTNRAAVGYTCVEADNENSPPLSGDTETPHKIKNIDPQ
jgi:hypothetical protein